MNAWAWYAYNAGDDITQRFLSTSTYDTAGQLTGMCVAWGACTTYTNSPQGERLSSTTTGNTTSLGYDQASRLTSYTAPGVTAAYTYDGDGLRATSTSSTSGNRNYTWDRTSGTVPLLLTDGTTRYLYGPGDLPVAEITASAVRYLHTDQANSVRTVTNDTGTVVATATWDAYGGRLATTGTQPRLGWQGQYTDPDTSLVYLRARYYDPTTATFITPDPLQVQTQTPYTYTQGDPWNHTDPSGLSWIGDAWDATSHFADDAWDIGRKASSSVAEAVDDSLEFAWRNRGTLATIGAAGACLAPGLGFAACGYWAAGAFAARASQRIEEHGFSSSLRGNLADAGITILTLGLGGAFETLAGPWAGVAGGIGAYERSAGLSYLGRLIPSGYDITNLFGWLEEQC